MGDAGDGHTYPDYICTQMYCLTMMMDDGETCIDDGCCLTMMMDDGDGETYVKYMCTQMERHRDYCIHVQLKYRL